jgi:hypothetical protein
MVRTCPYYVHPNAVCKHMATVENATDDNTLNTFPSEGDNDVEPEDCECDSLGGFSCRSCVRTGRNELPN